VLEIEFVEVGVSSNIGSPSGEIYVLAPGFGNEEVFLLKSVSL
jgi:hypothetical protein